MNRSRGQIFKSPFDYDKLKSLAKEWSEELGEHRLVLKKGQEEVLTNEEANSAVISFGSHTVITHFHRDYGMVHLPEDSRHREAILKGLKKYELVEKPNYSFGIGLYLIYFFAMLYQGFNHYLGLVEPNAAIFIPVMIGPIGLGLGLWMLHHSIKGRRNNILRMLSFMVMVASVMVATNPLMVPIVIILLLPLMTAIHRIELYNMVAAL